MGSPENERWGQSDERPQRTVRIAYRFAAGKYEVTWSQWQACLADGGCNGYTPNDDDFGRGSQPVINVNWNDAQAYVDWLSQKTGEEYRLLTEAEWEYAARAGSKTAYYWGEDPNDGCTHMNGADASFSRGYGSTSALACDDGFVSTAPVGSFRANGFGLYDMIGNVSEWVEDCYGNSGFKDQSYLGAPTDGSARHLENCRSPAFRGGSFATTSSALRSSFRSGSPSDFRNGTLGFRIARTL